MSLEEHAEIVGVSAFSNLNKAVVNIGLYAGSPKDGFSKWIASLAAGETSPTS